jgi:DNA-binding transcriptional MerR regulator
MSQSEDCISTPVGCAVFQRLKLLRRLQEVDLSPDEAWALLDRVQTHTSSADDRERLAHLIRVTTAVTDDLRAEPAEPEPPAPQRLSPERKAKRKRQLAKVARRRQRQ